MVFFVASRWTDSDGAIGVADAMERKYVFLDGS